MSSIWDKGCMLDDCVCVIWLDYPSLVGGVVYYCILLLTNLFLIIFYQYSPKLYSCFSVLNLVILSVLSTLFLFCLCYVICRLSVNNYWTFFHLRTVSTGWTCLRTSLITTCGRSSSRPSRAPSASLGSTKAALARWDAVRPLAGVD